ncbi:MAG: SDR family NAD(P)-dependent oxidoreductase [Aquabacterium sp.]|jgi:NAD(P)-dependent dehydrogenase (short-subunit alcohol dehydrogenase family)|uniref:SDR family NAD(P)-dependent oxidoreductase n=1 Tax=Aquabacterium sp. TaxID=1872578 RepID=UPI001B52AB62|nr:SDR family NAD(P)-dependent oxidoreductase [Aquabacterium sp.]MBP7131406.1 SDR family NAD(P)-dependent oxidoreductase [Aquabacterium sp.]MBP9063089.1 SDR family NAD(P)-dependent oxidoreductase [Aquabacterium sp.]
MSTLSSSASQDGLRFDGRVAIVTGAGGGLGRSHALQLAARGAKVLVNDLGSARDGSGGSSAAAEAVVAEIRAAGGVAMANGASVTDPAGVQAMVDQVMAEWGRIDILVNNAGILRDKSFSKMTLDDFRLVVDVHLMGSFYTTKVVWDIMKAQGYGRVIFTTSSSGLFGNFGQANYGAAKMAVVGLMQTLSLEGEKYNVRVNCLAPTAATRMTEDLMPPAVLALLTPERVSPGVVFLASEEAPTRTILCAGAGGFATSHITLTEGTVVLEGADAAEQVAARFAQIDDRAGEIVPGSGSAQTQNQLAQVMAVRAGG